MPDGHSAAIVEPVRELADVVEVQLVGVGTEIEVHVDIDAELPGQFEDAVDLTVRVAAGIRGGADD